MIKKIYPFILTIILIIALIGLPYLGFTYQQHSLVDKTQVEDIEDSDSEYSNSNTLDRIDFLSDSIPEEYDQLTLVDSYKFYYNLQSDQLNKIYNETKKLFDLGKKAAPSYDNIADYYDCRIVSFGDQTIINLFLIGFNMDDSTQVRLWIDSVTYKIYVLRLVNKTQSVSFDEDAFIQYLGISQDDFDKYYLSYNEGNYMIYDICKEYALNSNASAR